MANIAVNIMSQVVRLVRGILGTMMIVGVFLNLVNVIGRYVFLKPIIWAEEILTYGLVWVVMLGATLVTWRANHLKMDAIYDLMPQTLKRVINVLVNLSIIACGVFVVSQSYIFVSFLNRVGQKSVAAEIPMTLAHGAVLVGFILVILVVLIKFRDLVMEEQSIITQVEAEIGAREDSPLPTIQASGKDPAVSTTREGA